MKDTNKSESWAEAEGWQNLIKYVNKKTEVESY